MFNFSKVQPTDNYVWVGNEIHYQSNLYGFRHTHFYVFDVTYAALIVGYKHPSYYPTVL